MFTRNFHDKNSVFLRYAKNIYCLVSIFVVFFFFFFWRVSFSFSFRPSNFLISYAIFFLFCLLKYWCSGWRVLCSARDINMTLMLHKTLGKFIFVTMFIFYFKNIFLLNFKKHNLSKMITIINLVSLVVSFRKMHSNLFTYLIL